MIIGGILLLTLYRLNDSTVENMFSNSGELIVQQNIVETVLLLEHDFRKIGFCNDWQKIPVPTNSILVADSNGIKFLTDVNSDGNVDSLHYYLGDTSELNQTQNPRDRLLYRVENNATPDGSNLGITQFEITYFNSLGDTLSFPIQQTGEIYTIQIDITAENTSAYNDVYTAVFWRQLRLTARNLRNR